MMDEDIDVAAFFIIFGFISYVIKQQTRIQRITTKLLQMTQWNLLKDIVF